MSKDPNYRTADIALAAYLAMTTQRFLGVEAGRGGRCTFVFETYGGLETDVVNFMNRKTQVEPNGFLDQLKSLKSFTFYAGEEKTMKMID